MSEKSVSIQMQTQTPENPLELSSESFEKSLSIEKAKRDCLKRYINEHLIKDVDYGVIKINGAESKPCLFKPGAEKFCSLLHLTAKYKHDDETHSHLPQKLQDQGVICFTCDLINKAGSTVTVGRGACSIVEKKGNINTTLKIAKKRALVDAVLSLGLSDSFTQDIEDQVNNQPPPEYTARMNLFRQFFPLIAFVPTLTDKQRNFLAGITAQPLEKITEAIQKMRQAQQGGKNGRK